MDENEKAELASVEDTSANDSRVNEALSRLQEEVVEWNLLQSIVVPRFSLSICSC